MDAGRKAAAIAASRYVSGLIREQVEDGGEPPFVLALGSGRTAELFIGALAGLPEAERETLVCIPTSEPTWRAAERAGLDVVEESEESLIDLAVDGADEIGPGLSLIKGGGGALFRERIVAQCALEFVVIADENKVVQQHGAFPLPIEISPFCIRNTIAEIAMMLKEMGYDLDPVRDISFRTIGGAGRRMLTTENGNHIIDVSLGRLTDLEDLDAALTVLAGVIAHGLFLDLAEFALIGSANGRVRRIDSESERDNGRDGSNGKNGTAS